MNRLMFKMAQWSRLKKMSTLVRKNNFNKIATLSSSTNVKTLTTPVRFCHDDSLTKVGDNILQTRKVFSILGFSYFNV